MIWLTVIVFIVLLLLLVLVHEWGHYYTAKKAGCKVEEFGFGFPPRLFTFKRGETTFSFNLIPLGGFVKIEGENMDGDTDSPTSFASKSATWRIIILSAGVFMNMVLAAVLLAIQAGIGMPVGVSEENRDELKDIKTYVLYVAEDSAADEAGIKQFDRIISIDENEDPSVEEVRQALAKSSEDEVTFTLSRQGPIETVTLSAQENQFQTRIAGVAPNSPAEEAGINEGDKILSIQEIEFPALEDVLEVTQSNLGEEISMTVDREGEELTFALIPRPDPPPNQGPLGIQNEDLSLAGMHLDSLGLKTVAWWQAPWEGLKRTWLMLTAILTQFWLIIQRLFMEGSVGEALTGPVGIAVYAHEVTQMGASYLLEFAALISINLAIINLLPFPALDGGRIMFVIAEKIIGRRLPANVENVTHLIGFALLILLMLAVTFRDVQRFF